MNKALYFPQILHENTHLKYQDYIIKKTVTGQNPPGHVPPRHLPQGHVPPGHLPPGHLPSGHLLRMTHTPRSLTHWTLTP